MPAHKKRPSRAQQFKAKRQTKRIAKRRKHITVQEQIISRRGRETFAAAPTFERSKFTGRFTSVKQPQTPQDILLKSTAIQALAYDKRRQVLQIEFVEGGTWLYYNVPELIYQKLISDKTGSKGREFHRSVYGHWTGPKGAMTYHARYREVRVA